MTQLMDQSQLDRTLSQMARDILSFSEKNVPLALIGIRSRGVPLAQRLAKKIQEIGRISPQVGVLDITLYRDDLSRLAEHPLVKKTEILFPIDDSLVMLVDDVLYTGRTVRAALDALFDYGRPKKVGLAALVDRGGREIPIQADVVGTRYQAKEGENVKVRLKECDDLDKVEVI